MQRRPDRAFPESQRVFGRVRFRRRCHSSNLHQSRRPQPAVGKRSNRIRFPSRHPSGMAAAVHPHVPAGAVQERQGFVIGHRPAAVRATVRPVRRRRVIGHPLRNAAVEGTGLRLGARHSAVMLGDSGSFLEKPAPVIRVPF